MKKLALVALSAAFALSACGDSTDASDDAMADSVEIPADEAMADAPDPVMADEVTEEEETTVPVEQAEAAADAAEATVDDALAAAEEAQAVIDAAE